MAGSDSANLRSGLLNEALGFGGCGLYQSNPTGQEIIFSATCQKRSGKLRQLPPCATFASKQAKSHNYAHRYAQEARPGPSRVNSVPLERPDTTLEALSARKLVKTCSISKFELGRVSGSGAIFVGKIRFWICFGYESISKDFVRI